MPRIPDPTSKFSQILDSTSKQFLDSGIHMGREIFVMGRETHLANRQFVESSLGAQNKDIGRVSQTLLG